MTDAIHLFDLASQQARWLTVRQTAVAQNVANANTPGYKALDIPPFEDVFESMKLTMASTNSSHIGADPLDLADIVVKENMPWEVSHSGNSVSLEQEMIKASDVNRAYALNTSVVRAFNQMLSASVKP